VWENSKHRFLKSIVKVPGKSFSVKERKVKTQGKQIKQSIVTPDDEIYIRTVNL
jgi:hypothetical protein